MYSSRSKWCFRKKEKWVTTRKNQTKIFIEFLYINQFLGLFIKLIIILKINKRNFMEICEVKNITNQY